MYPIYNRVSGKFFIEPFPAANVIAIANILHDWDWEKKKILISKAFNALPEGGGLVVTENVVDDEQK